MRNAGNGVLSARDLDDSTREKIEGRLSRLLEGKEDSAVSANGAYSDTDDKREREVNLLLHKVSCPALSLMFSLQGSDVKAHCLLDGKRIDYCGPHMPPFYTLTI